MSVSNFQRFYGGIIWTNHAIDRLQKRNISQYDAVKVINDPDKTMLGKSDNSLKFIKTINGRQIHLIGNKNDNKEWVIVTAWVRGEEDKHGFPENVIYWLVGALWKLVKFVFRVFWKMITGKSK